MPRSQATVDTRFTATDMLTPRMRTMQNGVSRFASNARREMRQIAPVMRTAGLAVAGAATAALGYAVREFAQFDEAITASSAKFSDLNLTTEEGRATLERLGDTARQVGQTTKFSATEAAGGLDFLAMAGFTADQAMAALPGVTDLATVANVDLARATDIASDAIGAFGMMTADATELQANFTRINDVMAATMTSSNTTMEQLFESIQKGAPAFTAAGQSLESFNALAGVLANSGLKAGEAGTNLRNIMLRLADPTSEAAGILQELGVETQDAEGNFRDVVDIIGDFENGLRGMGTQQRSAALATVFGARAVTGMNVLLQEGSDSIRDYRREIEDSAGASEEMAGIIEGSLSNELKALKSAATEVGIAFVDAFEEDGRGGLNRLTESIREINVLPLVNLLRSVGEAYQKWQSVAGFVPRAIGNVLGEDGQERRQNRRERRRERREERQEQAEAISYGLTSPNMAMASSYRQESITRNQLAIQFQNAPRGTIGNLTGDRTDSITLDYGAEGTSLE